MSERELPVEPVELVVDDNQSGLRLDVFLANHFPTHSRVKLRRAITAGGVEVDGHRAKPAYRLRVNERVTVVLPNVPVECRQPEDIPLEVLYEDEAIVAINKPAAMVVHPSKGHWSGTLTAALAFHFQNLSTVGGPARPGIVHRLDRDTSGVILVAKTDEAHFGLAAQFEARTVEKEYMAIVVGNVDRDKDQIDQPIGVHPYQREKMAIRADHSTSRQARTFYSVDRRFDGFASLDVFPKTGRTHQVRLHLTHIGCPVLCDRKYGGRSQISRGEIARSDDPTVLLDRQALHARRIRFVHPSSRQPMDIVAPIPSDLMQVLTALDECRTI